MKKNFAISIVCAMIFGCSTKENETVGPQCMEQRYTLDEYAQESENGLLDNLDCDPVETIGNIEGKWKGTYPGASLYGNFDFTIEIGRRTDVDDFVFLSIPFCYVDQIDCDTNDWQACKNDRHGILAELKFEATSNQESVVNDLHDEFHSLLFVAEDVTGLEPTAGKDVLVGLDYLDEETDDDGYIRTLQIAVTSDSRMFFNFLRIDYQGSGTSDLPEINEWVEISEVQFMPIK